MNGVSAGEGIYTAKSFVSSNFYLDTWNFISVIFSEKVLKLYRNNIMSQTLNMLNSYIENGTNSMRIGGSFNTIQALSFYIWTFVIDLSFDQLQYMNSIQASDCIVAGCSSCNPAIIHNSISGCLSTVMNPKQDSKGKNCKSKDSSNGCISKKFLDCDCSFKSCVLLQSAHNCVCPEGAITSDTTCVCPTGYTIQWDICCEISCLNCSRTDKDKCLACIASNAVPDSVGCKCKEWKIILLLC